MIILNFVFCLIHVYILKQWDISRGARIANWVALVINGLAVTLHLAGM